MKIKKIKRIRISLISGILAALLLLGLSSCASENGGGDVSEKENPALAIEPQPAQMKSICELAVMDCYYHNVAKYYEKDAEGVLFWKKDKRFWIEYGGIVRFGIDVSLVNIDVDGAKITVTLPEAQVLSCKVDSSSLTRDSYIIDKNSADITGEDETKAMAEAQVKLEEKAKSDKRLITEARNRAQKLLEDYITNISNAVGKIYTVKWIYTDSSGKETGESEETVTRRPEGTDITAGTEDEAAEESAGSEPQESAGEE